MTEEHKQHSELFARVRSALGAAGEQEVRGRAALENIEEQLEAAQNILREERRWREETQEQLEALRSALYYEYRARLPERAARALVNEVLETKVPVC